jgi:hypothetical protein
MARVAAMAGMLKANRNVNTNYGCGMSVRVGDPDAGALDLIRRPAVYVCISNCDEVDAFEPERDEPPQPIASRADKRAGRLRRADSRAS